jgi:CBS domain-containing membrane protein
MQTQVFTISPDADITEAARVMWEEKIGCLLVAKAEQLVGILTEADFLKYILKNKTVG